MVGLGFGCALRGFERRVWSVTLWVFVVVVVVVPPLCRSFFCFPFFLSIFA